MNGTAVGTITFGQGGNADTKDQTGWSGPETGYTWAIGCKSTIRLPEADYTSPSMLELRCAPYIREGVPHQRVALSMCGKRFGEVSLSNSGTLAIALPPTRERSPVLTIEHPDAAVPLRGNDGRDLAIAFQRIRVMQTRRKALRFDSVAEAEGAAGMPVAEIVTSFESIGDDCELGFVQRAFGAEPLGLFRFASSRLDAMIDGIDGGFADILDGVAVTADAGCSFEWIAHNDRYGMHAHTFQYEHQIGHDEIFAKVRMHTAFLTRKFVADLEEGSKIFVLKNYHHEMLEPEALALFLAMRRRGPGRLLWVSVAPDGVPVGTVDEIMPGFWHGYVDRFAIDHMMNKISVAGWLAVLTNALLVANGSRVIKEGT